MTDEQKEWSSMAHMGKGHPQLLETRALISVAQKGNTSALGCHRSEETKARTSATLMGHVHSPETIARIIAGRNRPEVKARISMANTGRTASAETRAKESIASTGRIVSVETRAKKSATMNLPDVKARMSMAHIGKTGALSSHWKGGITPENACIRHSLEYVAWRIAVFERDNYTCQDCGQIGGDLEAHHVHEFAQYLDERFVVDNGKTLCLKCHNKTKLGRFKAQVSA